MISLATLVMASSISSEGMNLTKVLSKRVTVSLISLKIWRRKDTIFWFRSCGVIGENRYTP